MFTIFLLYTIVMLSMFLRARQAGRRRRSWWRLFVSLSGSIWCILCTLISIRRCFGILRAGRSYAEGVGKQSSSIYCQVAKVSAARRAECWITKGCGRFGRKSCLLRRELSSVHGILHNDGDFKCQRGVLSSRTNIAKTKAIICWQFVAYLCKDPQELCNNPWQEGSNARKTRVGTIKIAMINGITTWQSTRTLPLNIFSLRNFASWILITSRSVYTFLECLCSAMHCLT